VAHHIRYTKNYFSFSLPCAYVMIELEGVVP